MSTNSKSKQPKTPAQNKAIWALASKRGFAEEDLRDLCEQEFGSRSISKLTFDKANHLISKLGGNPFPTAELSRRGVQYHRQKAGVEQLPSQTHISLMWKLARERGMTDDGLASLCWKMLGHSKPRTTKETSKVIEALKAMNKRDANKAAEKEAA